MENVMTNGFAELSVEEMKTVDGGSLTVLGVAGAIATVGGAAAVFYETGKAYGKYYTWAMNGGVYDLFH